MKRKSFIALLLVICTLVTACTDKWKKVETAFRVGAPLVVTRFEQAGKLTPNEAQAIRAFIPQIVSDIKAKDFGSAAIHLGQLAQVKITNPEARQWLQDLLAVTSAILGVEIPVDEQLPMKVMKVREPDLSDENLRRLEELTK